MRFQSREDVIVFILFAIIGLVIPAVVVARHFLGSDPLALLHIEWGRTVVGVLFTVLATGVCLLNFYLAVFVPWLYKRRHGNMTGFACVSGLPVIGGFLVLFAGALMPPSIWLGVFLLALYLVDGHGLPRYLVLVTQS